MMLAEFDARRFADEVAAKVEAEGKGAISRALRSIPTATFNRMLHGTAPRNIDAIMSAAAYFGLKLIDFVKVRP